MKKMRSEAGQTFVLLAIMLIGLLGFSALAIDGGLLYHEHRRAQNAADSAAMAAAYAKVVGNPLGTVALNSAAANDFVTTPQACDPAGLDCILGVGTDLTIEVTNPPREGEYAGDSKYIRVYIEHGVQSNFAHLVFPGGLRNAAEAVSRAWPSEPYAPGYAITALTEHDCEGIWFSGTADTVIDGGGVFSNSDADSVSCQSGVQGGTGDVTVNPPHQIEVVGGFDIGGSGIVSPLPVEGVDPLETRAIITPDCSGLATDYGKEKINAGQTKTIQPGLYEEISVNSGNVTLSPGMYCIYGDKGFKATGGTVTGTGVMLYLQVGPFSLSANTTVNLTAEMNPDVLVDPSGNDWMGMLVFVDPSNTSDIILNGNQGTTYTGTVFAPSALVTLNGSGTTLGVNSQIIGLNVKITGTAEVDITYDQAMNYSLPPSIDLAK